MMISCYCDFGLQIIVNTSQEMLFFGINLEDIAVSIGWDEFEILCFKIQLNNLGSFNHSKVEYS